MTQDNQRIRVIHVGNDSQGTGGISSVIRNHANRNFIDIDVETVTSYHPGPASAVSRFGTVYRAIKRLRNPVHSPTIAHIHVSQGGSLIREGLLALFCKLRRWPVVVTLHGSSLATPSLSSRVFVHSLVRLADKVHGFGTVYKNQFSIPDAKWLMLPNDVPIYDNGSRPVPSRSRRILFAGEVGVRKGCDILISAWNTAGLHSWELVIAGPISNEWKTKALTTAGNVRIAGPLAHDDLIKLLLDTQILVQPSRAEAFPMSVCEALSAGCAVVGTRVGAMGELLDQAGQISANLSAEAFSSALKKLTNSPQLLEGQAEAGRKFAESSLSTVVVTALWEQVYGLLIDLNPKKSPLSEIRIIG